MAFDGDQFSYSPEFLHQWSLPKALLVRLPASLCAELEKWQTAGAAVLTALDRLSTLEEEAITRGWPEKTHAHLSRSRTNSNVPSFPNSPASSQDATSPPLNYGSSKDLKIAGPLPALRTDMRQDSVVTDSNGSFALVDTPPFTPDDCKPNYDEDTIMAPKALQKLDRELAPLARCDSLDSPGATQPQFDEAAWDIYVNSFDAELSHLQSEAMVRFRHLVHAVDKLWIDLQQDAQQPLLAVAKTDFMTWWKTMDERVKELDGEVRDLHKPDLELVKFERLNQGLPI